MYWGGESGANLIDNYLYPGTFDIYSEVPARTLLPTGFVVPKEDGEIKIYQKLAKSFFEVLNPEDRKVFYLGNPAASEAQPGVEGIKKARSAYAFIAGCDSARNKMNVPQPSAA
ncbi:hypothetical protein AGMMS50239_29220 [Bacteroidia bacterium]|nr:hypothetical protein AGMMS50239_29220 [Bacteroidia bacterium]